MKSSHLKWIVLAVAAAGVSAAAAWAAAPEKKEGPSTPASWTYDVKGGKRVPRLPRITHADGSWTEEYRAGNCTVTRAGRDGEVRETRKCD